MKGREGDRVGDIPPRGGGIRRTQSLASTVPKLAGWADEGPTTQSLTRKSTDDRRKVSHESDRFNMILLKFLPLVLDNHRHGIGVHVLRKRWYSISLRRKRLSVLGTRTAETGERSIFETVDVVCHFMRQSKRSATTSETTGERHKRARPTRQESTKWTDK